ILATVGRDGSIRLWDARTGEARGVLPGRTGAVNCVAISRDGRLASGGDDGVVRFWDLATGRLGQTGKRHTGPITCLAVNRGGKLLASASRNPDTTVRVWEGPTGRPLYTVPPLRTAVTGVAFSPDGKRLIVSDGVARRLHLYQPGTGRFLQWFNFA